MIICHCRAVNDRTVEAAIAAGADSVDDIGRACGAGLTCAACHPELDRLLSERARRMAGAAPGPLGAFRNWRHG